MTPRIVDVAGILTPSKVGCRGSIHSVWRVRACGRIGKAWPN